MTKADQAIQIRELSWARLLGQWSARVGQLHPDLVNGASCGLQQGLFHRGDPVVCEALRVPRAPDGPIWSWKFVDV